MPVFSKRDLKKLIIPLIIEQALALTIGMADTIMVSSCGEAAVSGISLVDSINQLLIAVFSALATGGSVVAAQYLGRRENKMASQSARQLVYATALLSVGVMVLCLCFSEPLIGTVFGQITQDVYDAALTYFLLSVISYPFLALYNAGAALFRAMGNSKISMINSLIMNVINIALNAVFIFLCGWGVFGAALATLIARIIGAVIILKMLSNRDLPAYVDRYVRGFTLNMGMIRAILRVGIPNSCENGMFQVGKLLVASIVSTFGTVSIAANAVCNSISGLMLIPGSAMGFAMITVIGQCMGAGRVEEAKAYTRQLMRWTYLFVWCVDAVIMLLGYPLLSLYGLSNETTELAHTLVILYGSAAMVIWPLAFTLPNALRASGDVTFTMVVAIATMWLFRLGGGYVLAVPLGMDVVGLYVGMFIDWLFRLILFVWRYQSGRWSRKKLLES